MSTTAIELIPETAPESALVAFTAPEGLDPFVEEIRNIVDSFEHDLTTATGRKKTASLAAKVSKFKVSLDNMGKSLVEDWKNKAKVVDATRKKMRDQLDELRDKARAPLTAWETAEEMRIQAIHNNINKIKNTNAEGTLSELKEKLEALHAIDVNESFEEFTEIALDTKEEKLKALTQAIEREEKAEADRIELERLRKAEAERLEAERLAKEKAEQEARAKAEAEAKAKEEERLRKEGEERARKEAESEAKRREEEAQRKELEARLAKEEAERKQKESEERAIQAEAKAKAEAEAEKKRIEAEEAKRKSNSEHNRKLKTEAKEAMMAEGIAEADAIKIIMAICANKIPHISMRF